ncbi:hypothetical protein PIB30_086806 [Stylosanthes scabra]|uniref:Uncharacterized protein n=1 Tax=Stylosanthes scabra TaxID=79078 RepID=A0ABU6VSX6_9FABA|nr:hypothetical protein [Stylosanthes scabra]
MDEQLLAVTKLATQIMQHFNSPQELHLRDSLDTVTLWSGTKLQESAIPEPTNHIIPGMRKHQMWSATPKSLWFLETEKSIRKAKEGIGSKGFTKRKPRDELGQRSSKQYHP